LPRSAGRVWLLLTNRAPRRQPWAALFLTARGQDLRFDIPYGHGLLPWPLARGPAITESAREGGT
jgi:hypothetical protein